jgi:hypothetical protein
MPKSSGGLTPAERSIRGALAAHVSWANTKAKDRTARTEPGRRAMWEKFYDQVDPDRKLTPVERHKLAVNARQAYFLRLALKSAKARRLAKEAGSGLKDGGAP